MNPWIKEIVEQICIGIILRESKPDSTNRLALIAVDNAVEVSLKFYAGYHSLLKDSDLDSPAGFFSALDKIKESGKISDSEYKDIRQYHKIRNDLYHRAKLTTVKGGIIDDYLKLAKLLLEKLYDFKITDVEWKKLVNDVRKALIKEKIELKDPIEFEARNIGSNDLVYLKTSAELQNTETIMLIIHGFIKNYARTPTKDELKKSLMISGRDINDNVRDVSISDLRKTGYMEKNDFKLKGKALDRLRKKFFI